MKRHRHLGSTIGLLSLLIGGGLFDSRSGFAQATSSQPVPTQADVQYGPHERNVLDLWQATASGPRPLVIYIHGGGFRNGSKASLSGGKIQQFLAAGLSVAALNYRLLDTAPLPAAHDDCRLAIQFLRSKAGAWNLDAERFGAFGGSAGAQLCMYLAFHDDMANPDSEDELQRQSTRLACVATNAGQTTMDFQWWKQNIPGYNKAHRSAADYFGNVSDQQRERVIKDVAALDLLTEDDPPIYMQYRMAPDDPVPADPNNVESWQIHHVNFGVALRKAAGEQGVTAHLKYPGASVAFDSDTAFFRDQLLSRDQ